MKLDYSTLVVGQDVAVCNSSRYSSKWQGVYVVTKKDKMKVVLKRVGDGYERSFSLKTNLELGMSVTKYNTAAIFTIAAYEADILSRNAENVKSGLWSDLKEAATRKDLFAVQTMLAKLEAVL